MVRKRRALSTSGIALRKCSPERFTRGPAAQFLRWGSKADPGAQGFSLLFSPCGASPSALFEVTVYDPTTTHDVMVDELDPHHALQFIGRGLAECHRAAVRGTPEEMNELRRLLEARATGTKRISLRRSARYFVKPTLDSLKLPAESQAALLGLAHELGKSGGRIAVPAVPAAPAAPASKASRRKPDTRPRSEDV